MSLNTLGPSTLPKLDSKLLYLNKLADSHGDINITRTISKPYVTNDISDILGASSSKPKLRSNPRDPLSIDGIEGAKSKVRDKFYNTKRSINPLAPDYPLPQYEMACSYEPKFLKDSMEIDDISGTRTKEKKYSSSRDILNVDDIEGASSSWKPAHTYVHIQNYAYL
jgi:hypothetical protein